MATTPIKAVERTLTVASHTAVLDDVMMNAVAIAAEFNPLGIRAAKKRPKLTTMSIIEATGRVKSLKSPTLATMKGLPQTLLRLRKGLDALPPRKRAMVESAFYQVQGSRRMIRSPLTSIVWKAIRELFPELARGAIAN